MDNFATFHQIYLNICLNYITIILITIKLDQGSFETKGQQNLQKTADFVMESIVFCPLVPPSWISLVDPTSAMYASAIYVVYIYGYYTYLPACPSTSLPNREAQLRVLLSLGRSILSKNSVVPDVPVVPFHVPQFRRCLVVPATQELFLYVKY